MKDTFLNAKLVQPDLLRLVIFSSLSWERIEPRLVVDGIPGPKMKPTRLNTLSALAIADFHLEKPLELGHSYFFVMPQYGSVPVDVSEAARFPDFDARFAYDGDDLGYTYSHKETKFALWAPLASKVIVSYRDKPTDEFTPVKMHRTQKGVFRAAIKGDHAGAEYHYFVTNSEISVRVTDPYAKGSTVNGGESVVVDFSAIKIRTHRVDLPILESPSDAIIYEAHVRDMTIHPDTNVQRKGTFLGMVEKGRMTKGGNPAGLDYILGLGVTHVQLLPIYDYKTVDETNPSSGYNWGYDPAQYFVPEGSFASVLNDPLSRIRDCKEMISQFHANGIRVVMDVVYNHVFEYENSVFEKVVPNYYFRHRSSGSMANTSGCGDDLASERPMVRKLIVDACKWWIDQYYVDGFRFDLMGIIDCETLNEIADYALSKDPRFLLYGEGWNMGGEVHQPLGHMGNYKDLPRYGFFNDYYRETYKRLFCEDLGALNDAKQTLIGSCVDYIYPAKFLDANQTVNYVECHDNATFFDFLAGRRGDLDEPTRLRLVEAATKAILFSIGIPFIHMGQEIGLTKFGEDNTYNKGDIYNRFDYALLDQRIEMSKRIGQAIALRRKLRPFHIFDPRVIGPALNVSDENGLIRMNFADTNLIAPRKNLELIINPTCRDIGVSLPEGSVGLLEPLAFQGEEGHKEALVPARSVLLVESY